MEKKINEGEWACDLEFKKNRFKLINTCKVFKVPDIQVAGIMFSVVEVFRTRHCGCRVEVYSL